MGTRKKIEDKKLNTARMILKKPAGLKEETLHRRITILFNDVLDAKFETQEAKITELPTLLRVFASKLEQSLIKGGKK